MSLERLVYLGLVRKTLRETSLGGGRIGILDARRSYSNAELVENDDGTFDLRGVEILSVGGPIHGIGSPPEGDYWTLDELRGMAEADAELGDELLPPNKIGHPDEQTLVQNSIDAGEIELPADGELPAIGWLEDLRVEGTKLLADVKRVPKVVAQVILAGAYRTRSVELAKVTSQTTGKTYDWVVTGMAWLGGKMPAVRTLGDVVALYEGDVPLRNRRVIQYQEGELVWTPEEGLEHLRAIVNEALNPGPGSMDAPVRYWVRDVAPGKALVEDWNEVGGVAWVVPFSMQEGRAVVAASDEWTRAEQAWVEVGRANEARALTLRDSRADTSPMRYTAEQRRSFAEATGLEESAVTDEMLAAAGVPENADEGEGATGSEGQGSGTEGAEGEGSGSAEGEGEGEGSGSDDADRSLEARLARTEARLAASETAARQERRREFVESAIRGRLVAPGQRQSLETLFDQGEDAARSFVAGLQPREDLEGEHGSDDLEVTDARDFAANDEAYQRFYEQRFSQAAQV